MVNINVMEKSYSARLCKVPRCGCAYSSWDHLKRDIDESSCKIKTIKPRNWGGSGPDPEFRDCYAIEIDGCLNILKEGEYEFRTYSDDGSAIIIDGEQVVNNWGCHGMRLRTGKKKLLPGQHKIKIVMNEWRYGSGLTFHMKPPGEDWQEPDITKCAEIPTLPAPPAPSIPKGIKIRCDEMGSVATCRCEQEIPTPPAPPVPPKPQVPSAATLPAPSMPSTIPPPPMPTVPSSKVSFSFR